MKRIAVVKGGHAFERQVSLRSGARAEESLRKLGHQVTAIDAGNDLVDQLKQATPDSVFLALHGPGGEDGTVQELLEVLQIPYTGSPVPACIRCCDKSLTKHTLREIGLNTPNFFTFNESAFKQFGAATALPEIDQRLGLPVVIKPVSQGSGLGVKLANSSEQITAALLTAFAYDSKVLIEQFVDGRDLAVSILQLDGKAQALPVVEAIPTDPDRFDFEGRYEVGMTNFCCPAELSEQLTLQAQRLALQAFEALGCKGFARVDMILDQSTDQLQIIEVDTVPGLTETSLLPQAAEAAGIGFDQLIEAMTATVS